MTRFLTLAIATALLAGPALADDAASEDAPPSAWTGSGELGIASARGNSRSDHLNGKFGLKYEDERWRHGINLAGLRARSEVTADFDGDGVEESRMELSANRYQFGLNSAKKITEYAYWVGAGRYEQDDFGSNRWQQTASVGYGYTFFRHHDHISLSAETGPGYRRAKVARTGEKEEDLILRSFFDYQHRLTDNTALVNTLLIEAGDDNTFAQNDLGLVVAMNSRLALKAGLQVRHNTDVEPETRRTDTLSTLNLVYKFN